MSEGWLVSSDCCPAPRWHRWRWHSGWDRRRSRPRPGPARRSRPAARASTEPARRRCACSTFEHAKHDLAPLRDNGQLRKAAQAYSARLFRERFFAHVCPAGSTLNSRIRRGTKYLGGSVRDWALGENLGLGSGSLGTPKSIVGAWMRSSAHRDAILDGDFRDIGVGVAAAPVGAPGRAATYTAEFGYRLTG